MGHKTSSWGKARHRRTTSRQEDTGQAAQLQQKLGNQRVLQLRRRAARRVIQSSGAPDWIKRELGFTPALEQAGQAAQGYVDAEESVQVPSGGEPLPATLKDQAEAHTGVLLDDVRVVHGADAACGPIGADAFAADSDGAGHVVALSSNVDLASSEGQFTLMHELAHVGQQKKGQTVDLDGLGGDNDKREKLERDADRVAAQMLS